MNELERIRRSKNLAGLSKRMNNDFDYNSMVIDMTSFLPPDTSSYRRLYHIKHNLNNIIKCKCGLDIKWNDKKKKYLKSCGSESCRKDVMVESCNTDEFINMCKVRNKKYWNNITDIELLNRITKTKSTLMSKYGVDSFAKTDEFKLHLKETYGYVSPFELKSTHDKSRKTLIDRYGVDHNFKIYGIQEEITKTFNENYGTDRPSQNKIIKQKGIDTCNDRYGGNSPMCSPGIRRKSITTLLENYGVDSPTKSKEILEKIRNTNIEKYGVDHCMKLDRYKDMLMNRTYRYKYKTIDGVEFIYQGYEDYVYEKLMMEYDQDDILFLVKDINSEIGGIYYEYNDGLHRYYPDFYIKSENKVIEVKSEYIYYKDEDVNLCKINATKSMGFNFELFIISFNEYRNWKNKNK